MKTKTKHLHLSLNFNYRGLSIVLQSFPLWIFWASYRSAGIQIHNGKPGGWSAYPRRQFNFGPVVISISAGEFARDEWPTEIAVDGPQFVGPDPTVWEPVRFVEGSSIDLETELAQDGSECTYPRPPKGWQVYRRVVN